MNHWKWAKVIRWIYSRYLLGKCEGFPRRSFNQHRSQRRWTFSSPFFVSSRDVSHPVFVQRCENIVIILDRRHYNISVIENVPIFYVAILKVIFCCARAWKFFVRNRNFENTRETMFKSRLTSEKHDESILVLFSSTQIFFFFFLPSTFVAEIFQSAIKILMRRDWRKKKYEEK